MKKNRKIALIYDFDKTLSPKDMQEFHYIQSLGYEDPIDFWNECAKIAKTNNSDSILAYMFAMMRKDKNLSRKELLNEGKYIKLYKGVDTWFKRINAYGKKHHIDVEHYVISSGLTDIIMGTSIAKEFKKVYGCTFIYDKDGKALWPGRVVNYTMKTQYLFRINKGVLNEGDDDTLNNSTPEERKYIHLEDMIYFGDGATDVPSMKVVQQNGGTTIAVFGDESKRPKAEQLYEDKRATYFVKADYSKGSTIEKIVMELIDGAEVRYKLAQYK